MLHLRFCRASKSHRIEQRSILKTSRATVRRAMTNVHSDMHTYQQFLKMNVGLGLVLGSAFV